MESIEKSTKLSTLFLKDDDVMKDQAGLLGPITEKAENLLKSVKKVLKGTKEASTTAKKPVLTSFI
jgi:hypothetical protein